MGLRTLKRGIVGFFAFAALFGVFFFSSQHQTSAAINPQINFQGKLTNPDGTNVTDGNYSIVFGIYVVGSGGSAVWTETQPTVAVTSGIFQVSLGSLTSLPGSVDFNSASLFLGIKVGADPEMTPRIQLTAAPYAFNSERLGGIASTGFLQVGPSVSQTDASTNNSIYLNKTGGTGNILDLQKSGTDVFVVNNAGMVTMQASAYTQNLVTISNGQTTATPTIPGTFSPSLTVRVSQTSGSRPLFFGYDNGAGTGWAGYLTAGACGAFTNMCLDFGNGTTTLTGLESVGTTLNVGGGDDGNFTDVAFKNTGTIKVIAAAAPTVDQVSISNVGQPTTTAGANGLSVNYVGGNASVEAAGVRIDYTPGGTAGGTWSGLRIVAATTGPVVGVTAYGIKIEGPTTPGAGTEVGLKITSGYDIGVDISSGGIQLATATSDPTTPTTGNLKVYAKMNAGRGFVKVLGPSGLDYSLQPSIFNNKIAWWTANGNATSVSVINFGNSITGTATTRNVATTNFLTATKRVSYVSAAPAGNSAGTRHNTAQYWIGNATGLGGFYYVARFGINSASATTRSFVGLSGTTGVFGNVNPSTLLNQLGFACDSTDTQFVFMHNNAAGASTRDALTGAFPCNTSGVDLYEARVFAPPNGTTVFYSLLRVNTGDFYEGSTATDLPANTLLMSPQIWINNATTAGAVDMSVISQYIETDN